MSRHTNSSLPFLSSLTFGLLVTLLLLLWFAGGASRADVMAQVVTRAGAWLILIVFILAGRWPRWGSMAPVAAFGIAAIIVVAVQLIPLPPSIWTELSGRVLLAQAPSVTGQEQPWRPLSISPGATINALSSLIVPFVTLVLLIGLTHFEHRRLVPILLGLVLTSVLIGLFQFSGARFDFPLINDVAGAVSGSFANRNHFALVVAIGCQLALVWGFQERHRYRWKEPVSLAMVLLFGLLILAIGSRTGVLVGLIGIATGLLIVRRRIMSELRRLPRWASVALVAGAVGLLGALLILSVALDRAVAFERALSLDMGEDLRRQALPTVFDMIELYFPWGSGFGTFDPAYRISEPSQLLSLAYFNHAHNDLLEVVLDGGILGLLLLVAAIVWWLWMSARAWLHTGASQDLLPRLGSSILLLVIVASLTDYPARTPMIMALIVIAAIWLCGANSARDVAEVPRRKGLKSVVGIPD